MAASMKARIESYGENGNEIGRSNRKHNENIERKRHQQKAANKERNGGS
jgi:hypothetical protein